MLTTELRLEEKGGAPNTNGHTRSLGFKYREEGVKYLRAARDIKEEMTSDVFLAACMMMSNADVSCIHLRHTLIVGIADMPVLAYWSEPVLERSPAPSSSLNSPKGRL